MRRETGGFSPGNWVEERQAPRRRLQILAIHAKPGHPMPNVELAVDGNPVNRLSLSLYALSDAARFRKLQTT